MKISYRHLCLLAAVLCSAEASFAQCSTRTPAFAAPASLDDTFSSVLTGIFPDSMDTTDYNGFQFPNSSFPLFQRGSLAGGFLFVTTPYGFQVWDVSTNERARSPLHLRVDRDFWEGDVPSWIPAGENKFIENSGAAYALGDFIYHINVGRTGVTIWEFDTRTVSGALATPPRLLYQDFTSGFRTFTEAHMAVVGGRLYAFAAKSGTGGASGVKVYDITSAIALTSPPCVEDTSSGSACGVHRGVIPFAPSSSGSAVSLSGWENFIVVSDGIHGWELWEMGTSILSPTVLLANDPGVVFDTSVWRQAGKAGLAVKTNSELTIHDISGCLSGGTCSFGAPTFTQSLAAINADVLQVSLVPGQALLYVAYPRSCSGRTNKQTAYDVTDPSAVVDLTPSLFEPQPNVGDPEVSIFTYYSQESESGFQFESPRHGVFNAAPDGNVYLYRFNFTMLIPDKLEIVVPRVSVAGPSPAFRDAPEQYVATANNCPGASGGVWDWDAGLFATITPVGSSGDTDTVSIEWSQEGVFEVTATNSACPDAEILGLSVTVAPPEPRIETVLINGLTVQPGSVFEAEVCSVLQLSATVSGQPPFDYLWELQDAGGGTVASSPNVSFSFDTTSRNGPQLPEDLDVLLDLGNALPPTDSATRSIRLLDLPPLGYGGGQSECLGAQGACFTQDPSGGPNIVLHANDVGANTWKWEYRAQGGGAWILIADFGIGTRTQNLTLGLGSWQVRSVVRNCVDDQASDTFIVNVTVINPLEAAFAPLCPFGICTFDQASPITFIDQSSGEIASWQYDFNHRTTSSTGCSFGSQQGAPTGAHTYSSSGTYYPCLRIRDDNGQTDTFVFTDGLTVNAVQNPPRVSVSCPSTTQTASLITCTATASFCSPSSTGWSWTTTGGTISGTTNGSQVRVSWSGTGNKTVRATNSSCGSAAGTDVVNVTSSGGGGGTPLSVDFTYSPSEPGLGAPVAFDASPSTGNIISYNWAFISPGLAIVFKSGRNVSHTFNQAAVHTVELTVSDTPGCGSPSCVKTTSKDIQIGADPNVLTPSFVTNPTQPKQGQQSTLDATSSTGPIRGYDWLIVSPSGISATRVGPTPSFTFSEFGDHEVKLTIVSQAGCSSNDCRESITADVAVVKTLDAAFTLQPTEPIAGLPVTLDNNSSGGPIVERHWTVTAPGGAKESFTGRVVNHTFAVQGLHTIELEVKSLAGCSVASCRDVETLQVFVNEPLVAAFTLTPSSPEQGMAGVLDASSSTGPIVQYEWTVASPGGQESSHSGITSTHFFGEAGVYTITLQVNTVPGCSLATCRDIAVEQVTVSEPLDAEIVISPPNPQQGQTIVLDGSGSAGPVVEWLWTITSPSGTQSEAGGAALDHVFSESGVHTVSLRVHSVAGCASSSCRDQEVTIVTVSSVLVAAFQVSPSVLIVGSQATLDGSSSAGPVVEWLWTITGPGGTQSEASGAVIDHVFTEAGVHTVSLRVHSVAGCTGSSCRDEEVTMVTVTPALTAAFQIRPSVPIVGVPATLDGSSSTGAIVNWRWSISAPSGAVSETAGELAQFVFGEAGNHQVTLVVDSGCGNSSCEHSTSATVTALEPLNADFLVPYVTQGDSVLLDASPSTGAIVEWRWTIFEPDGATTNLSGEVAQMVFSKLGSYTIILDVRSVPGCDSGGCHSTRVQSISVAEPLQAVLQAPSAVTLGETVQLDGSSSSGPIVEYLWDLVGPKGSETAVGPTVSHTFVDEGEHSVTLRVARIEGCEDPSCSSTSTALVQVSVNLEASFVVSPDPPKIGEFALFDASNTTGNPDRYEWRIGSRNLVGQTISIQFVEMGPVEVELTVFRGANTSTVSRTIQVEGPCVADEENLCLNRGRFQAGVQWRDRDGNIGTGRLRSERTDSSGLIWFFNENNVEMLIKLLDGCGFNGFYWVFAAATTDVEYTLTVEDLLSDAKFTYTNPLGSASDAITEITALDSCPAGPSASVARVGEWHLSTPTEIERAGLNRHEAAMAPIVERAEGPIGSCAADDETFCFGNSRFEATVAFTSRDGTTGNARTVAIDSPDSGVYYFFDPLNWEILAKVVDACGFNQRYWVLAAATTDQGYTLSVTDTVADETVTYSNPLGTRSAAIIDTDALATCDAQ